MSRDMISAKELLKRLEERKDQLRKDFIANRLHTMDHVRRRQELNYIIGIVEGMTEDET